MPAWCDAALSAILFVLGVASVARWGAPARRALGAALMLLGAAWLLFTGSSGYRLDGWAYALFALGAIPALCLASLRGPGADPCCASDSNRDADKRG